MPMSGKSFTTSLLRNIPTQPDIGCEFRRIYDHNVSSWKEMRVWFLGLIVFTIVILIAAAFGTDAGVTLTAAFVGLLVSIAIFCGGNWYRYESMFRFLVNRCKALAERFDKDPKSDERTEFVRQVEDRIAEWGIGG